MSIEVRSISKLYSGQRALDQVSFSINTGEVVGFLGPNGAGKSTMMKILTCFIPPSEGSAEVVGHDIHKESMKVRQQVGYLPEHNPLYPDMYVKEYLGFVAGVYKLKDRSSRVKEMIGRVGLEREQHKKIGALSKGYRQRVGLAQAMIHDPAVLILDEPTSGLDPNQLVDIRELIKGMGREKTVMLSTHIMQEVEAICDRVLIIDNGKLVADDRAENLRSLKGKQDKLLVEFDDAISASQLSALPGIVHAQHLGANRWEIITKGEDDVRPLLFQFAVDSQRKVLTMQAGTRGMEDVFKELTAPKNG